jgi:TolB-like protein/class 3 adenylate cyclase
MERRLTAILAADVVGYSRLMGEDEVGTLQRLKKLRRELVTPVIQELHGNVVKLMGDGALVEFASVVDAVQCAVTIQRRMIDHNQETPEKHRIRFRIGVNLGDVIVDGDDIYGDGVNIAARLEAMAEPDGICISGTAFDHAVHKVDVGFAELGQQHLKNIADPVRVYAILLDPAKRGKLVAARHRPTKRTMALAVAALLLVAISAAAVLWQRPHEPQRQSVAVLPFANLSEGSGQDYFADGITEDLITDLAKLSGIDVVSRNSVLAYKNRPSALTVIARDLGARFIVEGSVRRAGDQIRVNAQVIDIVTGDNLWANRYDGSINGLFSIQSQMGREIAQALGVRPSETEKERMGRPPTTNLEAYDYFLRAQQAAHTGSRAGLREALALFDRAEELDPAFGAAFAADARTAVYIWRISFNDVLQTAPARKRAYEKASRALEIDPNLSSPHAILGIMQVLDRRYEEAISSAHRAVTLDPGDAEAQIALAYVQLFAGNHAEAATAAEAALKLEPGLSPIDRQIAGLVFLFKGDAAKAVETLERARDDSPDTGEPRIILAAAYVRAGRLNDAQKEIAEGLRIGVVFDSLAAWRVSCAHFRKAEDLAFIVDALRKAGLPEWLYGFSADAGNQLKGPEIESLVLGHILRGELEPDGQPALMQIGQNGKAGFRSRTRLLTGTVFVSGDLLCERSENMFGRPDCGPIYKRDAPSTGYTFVNSSKVFHFTVVK